MERRTEKRGHNHSQDVKEPVSGLGATRSLWPQRKEMTVNLPPRKVLFHADGSKYKSFLIKEIFNYNMCTVAGVQHFFGPRMRRRLCSFLVVMFILWRPESVPSSSLSSPARRSSAARGITSHFVACCLLRSSLPLGQPNAPIAID